MKKKIYIVAAFFTILLGCTANTDTLTPIPTIMISSSPTPTKKPSPTPTATPTVTATPEPDPFDISWWVDNRGGNKRITTYKENMYTSLTENNGGITRLMQEPDYDEIDRFAIALTNSFIYKNPGQELTVPSENEGVAHRICLNFGEAMLVYEDSEDGLWCHIKTMYGEGWTEKETLGFFENREKFENYQFYVEVNWNGIIGVFSTGNVRVVCADSRGEAKDGDLLYQGKLRFGTQLLGSVGDAVFIDTPWLRENGRVSIEPGGTMQTEIVNSNKSFTIKNFYKQLALLLAEAPEDRLDCAATTKGIYDNHLVRLPATAEAQINIPKCQVDLSQMDRETKTETICQMPPATMLYKEGHILLLLGAFNGEAYAFDADHSRIVALNGEEKVIDSITRATYLEEIN